MEPNEVYEEDSFEDDDDEDYIGVIDVLDDEWDDLDEPFDVDETY